MKEPIEITVLPDNFLLASDVSVILDGYVTEMSSPELDRFILKERRAEEEKISGKYAKQLEYLIDKIEKKIIAAEKSLQVTKYPLLTSPDASKRNEFYQINQNILTLFASPRDESQLIAQLELFTQTGKTDGVMLFKAMIQGKNKSTKIANMISEYEKSLEVPGAAEKIFEIKQTLEGMRKMKRSMEKELYQKDSGKFYLANFDLSTESLKIIERGSPLFYKRIMDNKYKRG